MGDVIGEIFGTMLIDSILMSLMYPWLIIALILLIITIVIFGVVRKLRKLFVICCSIALVLLFCMFSTYWFNWGDGQNITLFEF